MLQQPFVEKREPLTKSLSCDLAIIGGGLAGTCCAITAARAGLKVVLVQDRPVLGGNASSEVRLWTLGATAHMGAPNRWAREGGVIDEILVENIWRNPEGNALLFDTVLLEKVVDEPNITLLLNTAAFEVQKSAADHIESVRAFCSQNSTLYEIRAPLFCDASGDGIVAFLAGAAFRMGAEARAEFDEPFAPTEEYGELLGHSIYFYSKDVGRPVQFMPPSFALDDITKIPRFRQFNARDYGCKLWWIEWGGRLDTVHETETIKWELWKVVYGVWNYIKNSGQFPDAENLTLEWVGHIPGKRESRRFEGDTIMTQSDVMQQRDFPDPVAFGGWALDLHPADGVFSAMPGCTHWRMKGIYPIPYRSLYSRNISNLFLAGRIISVSHVAFGTTRVMATLAHAAQAVGFAAALCRRDNVLPAAIAEPGHIENLQRDLLRSGQHIPGRRLQDPDDLAQDANVTASSQLQLSRLPADGPLAPIGKGRAQMLPLQKGKAPQVSVLVNAEAARTLPIELRISSRPDNYTPDVLLARKEVSLQAGREQSVTFDFDVEINEPCYGFFCVGDGVCDYEGVTVHTSESRLTGVLSVVFRHVQAPPEDIGVETFPIWTPERRPNGRNFALRVEPALDTFAPKNVLNGIQRPTNAPNAWVASLDDPAPVLTLQWNAPQSIAHLELFFDTDYDHPMESVLMGHPERAMPFCVKHYQVRDDQGRIIAEATDNHQTRNAWKLDAPVETSRLDVHVLEMHGNAPAVLFEVRCYDAVFKE